MTKAKAYSGVLTVCFNLCKCGTYLKTGGDSLWLNHLQSSKILLNVEILAITCPICSSTKDVEGGLQTLNQAKPSSNALFAQYRVAAQEHLLDAATERAGKGLVFAHRFYGEQAVKQKHLNINNSM